MLDVAFSAVFTAQMKIFLICQTILSPDIERLSAKMTTFAHRLIGFVWRQLNNQKELTPVNGISPDFISSQKVLSDTNNNVCLLVCHRFILQVFLVSVSHSKPSCLQMILRPAVFVRKIEQHEPIVVELTSQRL